jgi:hypothetical protein
MKKNKKLSVIGTFLAYFAFNSRILLFCLNLDSKYLSLLTELIRKN